MINKLLTPKNLRNLIIIMVVAGVLFLAISGYLTPVFSFSVSPLISAQSWLSQRYLAFSDFFNSPRDMATLRAQNAQLENEVAMLQSEIVALQENLAQSDILYTLLDFARTNPEHEYVAATVIGREISPFLQYIIIDKGSNDGLRHGMPVVTQQGLVGRIDALISDASRIQLITDANSSVNVKLQTAGVEGLVRGSVTGEISLDMVPVDSEVQIGDILMTSGLGGTYPPNIFVGQVLTMQSKQNVLFQTGSVQPVVDFSNLSAVLVITNFNSVDISPLVPEVAMWSYLIGFTGFLLTAVLQMSIFSQWKILSGSADIVLLFVVAWCLHDRNKQLWLLVIVMAGIAGSISALPAYIPIVVSLFVFRVSKLFQARLMQSPLLSMLVLTFAATLLQLILCMGYLFVIQIDLNFSDALVEVAFPSVLLNMLLAIPIHAIVREIGVYAFPKGVEA